MQNFSTIATPLTNCLRKGKLSWGQQDLSFALIKEKHTATPALALPNFDKVFEVETDACLTGIEAILTQEGRPIEFFSENFNEVCKKWTTYD